MQENSKYNLSPGSKGWIEKYFDLVDKDIIRLDIERTEDLRKLNFIRLTMCNTGIVFGYPLQLIFARNISDEKWTQEEKLKLLLFECHLFMFIQINNDIAFDKELFIETLCDFYKHHNNGGIKRVLSLFSKPKGTLFLESVLAERINIKLNILDNKWWVNSLSNAFAYLDVILFDDFVHKNEEQALQNYSGYAKNSLIALIMAAQADRVIEDSEKAMINVFLASSGLDESYRDSIKLLLETDADFVDFSMFISQHWLLKNFILDVSTLLIYSNHEPTEEEKTFLQSLATYFELTEEDLEETKSIVETFVLTHKDSIAYLRDSSSYDKVYFSLTNRYKKILLRNKDKIAAEVRESKELISLIRKSTKEELSIEEKDAVKEQLKDLAKTVPALTVFMIPGGSILLPLLMKLIPDLVPSAFRENQIEDEPKDD